MTPLEHIQDALQHINDFINTTNWRMPVVHPDQNRKLVEAMADAMRCRDKLVIAYVMIENPHMTTRQAHHEAQGRFSFSEGPSKCSGGCDTLQKARELIGGSDNG